MFSLVGYITHSIQQNKCALKRLSSSVQYPAPAAPPPPIFASASAAAVHRQQSNRPLYRELSDDDSLFFANSVLIQDKLTSVKWRFYTISGYQDKNGN